MHTRLRTALMHARKSAGTYGRDKYMGLAAQYAGLLMVIADALYVSYMYMRVHTIRRARDLRWQATLSMFMSYCCCGM